MKNFKLHLFTYLAVIMAVALATSCSGKLQPLSASLFTADPTPLELVGNKVPVTINGRFPAKWFNKNVTVVVTPLLKYQGGEALGESLSFQGENVSGNGIVINQNTGGTITLRTSFNYVPAMKQSELYLRFRITKGGKELNEIPDVKIADGVVATAALANPLTVTPSIAPDKFERIIEEAHDANILFMIQQAELRSSELNSSNLEAWKKLVKEADENSHKRLNVEISAYASPDGGVSLNEKLAEKRESNTKAYLEKEFKKNGVDTEINAHYTAQDWDGFQKLVQASSLQDKELVLRVLSMYSDPVAREREIKNISFIYSELAETILPQLRRSRLIANVEIIGKTDEVLEKAVKTTDGMKSLSVEELLYAATIKGVDSGKIYKFATEAFPSDYRGWNNLGACYFSKGDFDSAKSAFLKAASLSPNAPEANMNLALFALNNGDIAKAEQLLGSSAGAKSLGDAMGVLYLKKGEYSKAVQAFGDSKSNNAALAQLLTKNYNKAQQTLNGVDNKNASTYYLMALVAARTNNASGVAGNLRSALDKGAKASDLKTDIEFARFLSNPDIANMLR